MRSRAASVSLIGLATWLIVPFASGGAQAAQRNAAVVVESWWSGDYAEKSCEQANSFMTEEAQARIRTFGCGAVAGCPQIMARLTACMSPGEPKAQAHRFEDRLMREFAANPRCKGASFARDYGLTGQQPSADERAVMSRPHWELSIDFVAGAPAQSWSLQYLGEPEVLHGQGGTEAAIAGDICAILRRRGDPPPR
jgi:hypothetical protein